MNWPLIISWLLVLAPVVWLLYVLAKWHRHAVYMRKLEEQRQAAIDLNAAREALTRGLLRSKTEAERSPCAYCGERVIHKADCHLRRRGKSTLGTMLLAPKTWRKDHT